VRPRVLLVDNYDSFTYNLAQAIGVIGADVEVRRADAVSPSDVAAAPPHALVVSPGPGTPERAGNSMALIRSLSGVVPILGVCLGHQAIGAVFGGNVVRAAAPMHGKTSTIEHDGRTIFRGLSSPLTVGRYHSLVVDPALPDCLEETARGGGVLMGLRHRELPAEGVQFHPESVLTEQGRELLANFLDIERS